MDKINIALTPDELYLILNIKEKCKETAAYTLDVKERAQFAKLLE